MALYPEHAGRTHARGGLAATAHLPATGMAPRPGICSRGLLCATTCAATAFHAWLRAASASHTCLPMYLYNHVPIMAPSGTGFRVIFSTVYGLLASAIPQGNFTGC